MCGSRKHLGRTTNSSASGPARNVRVQGRGREELVKSFWGGRVPVGLRKRDGPDLSHTYTSDKSRHSSAVLHGHLGVPRGDFWVGGVIHELELDKPGF